MGYVMSEGLEDDHAWGEGRDLQRGTCGLFEGVVPVITWRDYIHVCVIYFSVYLLQNMEIVILITTEGIQQHGVCVCVYTHTYIHTYTHTQNWRENFYQ
jgi:hypothetical protein